MEDTLITLYCLVDDFCKAFSPFWKKHCLGNQINRRCRNTQMSTSEIMTIVIHFHQSGYRPFKQYYLCHVQRHLKSYFSPLVSDQRMVALMKRILLHLSVFLHTLTGEKTGIYFVDSTPIKVCHIKRAKQNRIFRSLASKSKSSVEWFFGFKLHLVINNKGELMAFKLTASTMDDRHPVLEWMKNLSGKLFGDKGYISSDLSEKLIEKGVHLITRIKKNMKNKLIETMDKILLRKRAVIESVNDQLKNISQIEQTSKYLE